MGSGGLSAVIAMGVEAARAATEGEQRLLTWEAWQGSLGFGRNDYAPAVTLKALVQLHPTGPAAGNVAAGVIATVVLLQPLPPNGAPGRQEPVDPRDRFTLHDGTVAKAVEWRGAMVNEGTGLPYMSQLRLGKAST